MWTKHLTTEGKVFYFNAAQNRSVWNPPPESVVHEAPNIKPIGSSSFTIEYTQVVEAQVHTTDINQTLVHIQPSTSPNVPSVPISDEASKNESM